jgi:hypothetical protein
VLSLYNFVSPIISLLLPIIALIMPFIIIKLKGLAITWTIYVDFLKQLANSNSVFQLMQHFKDGSHSQKAKLVLSAALYIFSIYQNIVSCYRHHENMKQIHQYFSSLVQYINHTLLRQQTYLQYAEPLTTHSVFNKTVVDNSIKLATLRDELVIFPQYYSMTNIRCISKMGLLMKQFYSLHSNESQQQTLLFAVGFNSYLHLLNGLSKNIDKNYIHFANFDASCTIQRDIYHPSLTYTESIKKNTVDFSSNIIITGPNASGKTTILKSAILNTIFSQQFGCGFYSSADIVPFHHIHCYLNIPDTSGRDSLFQAEARRCKDIITSIDNHEQHERHLCVFDELYSGTNPSDAENSAYNFIKYISSKVNASFILTTHYVKVCKKIKTWVEKSTESKEMKNVINYKMKTVIENDQLKYYYKIVRGISKLKGGVFILSDMNYPTMITEGMKNT